MNQQIPTHAEVPVIRLQISSKCRRLHGDMGAFDKAVRSARVEYEALMPSWPLSEEAEFLLNLIVRYPRK